MISAPSVTMFAAFVLPGVLAAQEKITFSIRALATDDAQRNGVHFDLKEEGPTTACLACSSDPAIWCVLSGDQARGDRRPPGSRLIMRIGNQARKVVPQLMLALHDDNDQLRFEAITALGMIGPNAKDAIPSLEALSTLEDLQTAERAEAALRQIRSWVERVGGTKGLSAIGTPKPRVRNGSAWHDGASHHPVSPPVPGSSSRLSARRS